MGRDPALALAYPDALLADQLGAMLAAALEPQAHIASATSRDLVGKAKKLFSQQLDRASLNANEIAQALGVSMRTLHRSFASEQLTVAGTLRAMRVQLASHMLDQNRFNHLSVAEIGRRCGFMDVSHFVRTYKKTFDDTPAHWRKNAKNLAQTR